MPNNPTIYPTDLDDLLLELKTEIFSQLNCVQIGKIQSVNLSEQTAEIEIQFKRQVTDDKIVDYPLLVDCPIFVMQGGGSFIEFPIQPGDFCLVLFNDRNIDQWWAKGAKAAPVGQRKHSLSDGFALVGINPKTSALNLSGDKIIIKSDNYPIRLEAGAGFLELNNTTGQVNVNDNLTVDV
jgi:hypothetical protein